MKKFEEPKVQISEYEVEDIITASNGEDNTNDQEL